MYFLLFSLFTCLSACDCLNEKAEEIENYCVFWEQFLESSVLLEVNKEGFHREVVTFVKLNLDIFTGIRVMLLYRWPRGVYLDPYQLASLGDESNWQILIDSTIDLEVPAHETSGFVAFVYPIHKGPTSRLNITIPIHGRYHKPSFDGTVFASVDIEPPELLLWTENCMQSNSFEHLTVVDAPCSPGSSSSCPWVKSHHQQEQVSVNLQFPTGDGFLLMPVCSGTLLVTMICCVALAKYMWGHRIG